MQKLFRLLTFLTAMIFVGASANAEVIKMTPEVAREKALVGELVVIDIRRPEEWAETGVPDVALLLDMTSKEFLHGINAIRLQNPNLPLAFICRTGNRTNYLTGELEKLGYSGIVDVIGGMSGSRADKGWAKRRLPIRSVNDPVNPLITVTQP